MKMTIKYVVMGVLLSLLFSISSIGSIVLGVKNLIFDIPDLNGFLALILGMVDVGLILSGLFICGVVGYYICDSKGDNHHD